MTVLKNRYNSAADQLTAARAMLSRAELIRDAAAHHASQLISAYLLLSFSTPLAPLAGALTGMFDAIASTLRWIP